MDAILKSWNSVGLSFFQNLVLAMPRKSVEMLQRSGAQNSLLCF